MRKSGRQCYFSASNATLDRQAHSIVEMTKAKRLPSMFYLQGVVADGGLARYRDYSRFRCAVGDMQLGPNARISAGMLGQATPAELARSRIPAMETSRV
jgi:hypothetical protein